MVHRSNNKLILRHSIQLGIKPSVFRYIFIRNKYPNSQMLLIALLPTIFAFKTTLKVL